MKKIFFALLGYVAQFFTFFLETARYLKLYFLTPHGKTRHFFDKFFEFIWRKVKHLFIKINQTFFSDTPKPFGSDSALEKMGFERSIGFGSPESKFISKSATESSTIIVEKRDVNNLIGLNLPQKLPQHRPGTWPCYKLEILLFWTG